MPLSECNLSMLAEWGSPNFCCHQVRSVASSLSKSLSTPQKTSESPAKKQSTKKDF